MSDDRNFPQDWAAPAPQAEPQYTNRHGERCSQACGEGRHSECTETLATCNCTCRGGHKTMHRYMNMSAAPAPQAEGMSAYPITEGNSNWKYVGAAPAETARPENDSDIVGVCDDVTRGRTLHVKDIGCINWRPVLVDTGRETAGEMTARQFDEIHRFDIGTYHGTMEFAGAFAKQRVEQVERKRLDERAEWKNFLDAAHAARDAFESDVDALQSKVADLERERDNEIAKKETWRLLAGSNQTTATEALALVEKERAELREMRERVTDLVGIIGRLQERLARKAGS